MGLLGEPRERLDRVGGVMDVCDVWLRDDFLTRAGFEIRTTPDGRRVATNEDRAYTLGPACGHSAESCPPPKPAVREIGEAA